MERKDILEFLKLETDIQWLKKLNKFINSHIEFLESLNELEKSLKEKEQI